MLSTEFKEALKLMGGKAALFDESGGYIVMTLGEFKKLNGERSLTKQEPLDKINSDVELWKKSEEAKNERSVNSQEPKEKEEEIKYVR